MKVRLPKIDYSNVRPHWARAPEFAHDRNASSTIPSEVEPYLIKVMRLAKKELPKHETQLHEELDLFIAQEGAHYRQHNLFNRRIREYYPKLADFEAELRRDLDGYLANRSLKFNIAYSEGFETMGPPAAEMWFEHSDEWLEGADEAPAHCGSGTWQRSTSTATSATGCCTHCMPGRHGRESRTGGYTASTVSGPRRRIWAATPRAYAPTCSRPTTRRWTPQRSPPRTGA